MTDFDKIQIFPRTQLDIWKGNLLQRFDTGLFQQGVTTGLNRDVYAATALPGGFPRRFNGDGFLMIGGVPVNDFDRIFPCTGYYGRFSGQTGRPNITIAQVRRPNRSRTSAVPPGPSRPKARQKSAGRRTDRRVDAGPPGIPVSA